MTPAKHRTTADLVAARRARLQAKTNLAAAKAAERTRETKLGLMAAQLAVALVWLSRQPGGARWVRRVLDALDAEGE